jgi:hypothetical protein
VLGWIVADVDATDERGTNAAVEIPLPRGRDDGGIVISDQWGVVRSCMNCTMLEKSSGSPVTSSSPPAVPHFTQDCTWPLVDRLNS